MTYLIGAILVLLLLALVLVLRPPKQKPRNAIPQRETVEEEAPAADDQLDLDIGYGGKKTEEHSEELVLTLDESPDAGHARAAEGREELDLFLSDDDGHVPAGGMVAEKTPETAAPEETAGDEYDEDVPFIEEGEGGFERSGEVAPALADVPDNYAQFGEDDETPDELAERLEYFLGADDGKTEAVSIEEEQSADDTGVVEDAAESGKEETVEAVPEPETEPEAVHDVFETELKQQEERLRGKLEAAIAGRETSKIGPLTVALESLCARLADLPESIQQHQGLLEEFKTVMEKTGQALPGFQLDTVRASLIKGDYEIVQTMLAEAAGQLDASPQLAAELQYHWGRFEEERGDLDSALEMYTKAFRGDEGNPDYHSAAGRMARIMGDTDNALALLEQRVSTGREQGEESVSMAGAEHELARALVMADDKERVEELLTHSLQVMEKLQGPEHPDLAPVLHDLALLHDSAGRYEQAEPLYERAIEITEKASGKDSPRLGAMLNKLAALYEEIEMEGKSEPLYERALAIKQRVLGENHPDVGSIMGHLANLLRLKGKYDQAEPLYRKSLAIAEVALGKDHPNLAVVLNDMAEMYSQMGNEEQAELFQERAFASFGLPGMGDGFVEMEKDTPDQVDDDNDQTVTGG